MTPSRKLSSRCENGLESIEAAVDSTAAKAKRKSGPPACFKLCSLFILLFLSAFDGFVADR